MKNFEILTSNEKGFTIGNTWLDHNTFAPDEETARAIAASLKKEFKEVIILDLKKNRRLF